MRAAGQCSIAFLCSWWCSLSSILPCAPAPPPALPPPSSLNTLLHTGKGESSGSEVGEDEGDAFDDAELLEGDELEDEDEGAFVCWD